MRNYKVPPIPASIWQKPSHFIAFGFGAGALPIAPGTFGTLLAIPFYLLLRPLPVIAYIIAVALIAAGSAWLCQRVSDEIKIEDHQGMCLDEFVGFFATMIAAPEGWGWIMLGVILFRIFDILKPWPIRQIDEKVKGGIGMILDDLLAGLFSCIILHIIAWML